MQVFSYDKYQQKVLNQVTTTSHLRARRGTIYDGAGNVLAESKTEWRVFLSPVDIRDCSKKSGRDYAGEISKTIWNSPKWEDRNPKNGVLSVDASINPLKGLL